MEILDIVDTHGIPTGETVDREIAHAKGIRHRTSHVWLARKKNGNVQILLQKRSANKDSHPSCYDISSAGHIPAGVDFIPSAVREMQEELGVTIAPEQLIFCGQRVFQADCIFHGKPFRDNQVSNIYLVWMDLDENAFTIQTSELSEVRWMDFETCCQAVRDNTIPHCIYLEELEILRPHLEGQSF